MLERSPSDPPTIKIEKVHKKGMKVVQILTPAITPIRFRSRWSTPPWMKFDKSARSMLQLFGEIVKLKSGLCERY
jgi:hypothetical protein